MIAMPAPSPARVWWLASRPATLTASAAPVLAGTAAAVHAGAPRVLPGLLALAVAIALQVGVNYANDYSDFVRGADTPARRGPLRAAASGIVSPRSVRAAAVAALAAAAVAGLAIALLVDLRLLAVGAAAIAAAWLYTGGPRPYGYLGLGEVFVFLFFGLVAAGGTEYVEVGTVDALGMIAGVGTGALACAILAVNNLRDIPTDLAAGKRTLAARLGERRALVLVTVLLLLPFAVPVAGLLAGAGRWTLLPLVAAPMAVRVRRLAASGDAVTQVGALRACAELEAWWALLFAAGVAVG